MTTQLIIRSTVADFDVWKPAFDKHESKRKDATLGLVSLLRGLENDKDITVIFSVGDVNKAKALLSSDDLKQAMNDAGVVASSVNIYFGRSA